MTITTYDHTVAAAERREALSTAESEVRAIAADLEAAELSLEEVECEHLTLSNRQELGERKRAAQLNVEQLTEMLSAAEANVMGARGALLTEDTDLAAALVPMVTAALPGRLVPKVLPYLPQEVPDVSTGPDAVLAQTGPTEHDSAGYLAASLDRGPWATGVAKTVHLVWTGSEIYATPTVEKLVATATDYGVDIGQRSSGVPLQDLVPVTVREVEGTIVVMMSFGVELVYPQLPVADWSGYTPPAKPVDLSAAIEERLAPSHLSGGRAHAECSNAVTTAVSKGVRTTMVRLSVTARSDFSESIEELYDDVESVIGAQLGEAYPYLGRLEKVETLQRKPSRVSYAIPAGFIEADLTFKSAVPEGTKG